MSKETRMILNAILEEIGQIDKRINKRFDKIGCKPDSLQHEVNARKLGRKVIGLLIKKREQLESRIEKLEK